VAFVQTAGLAKVDCAEATQANGLVFIHGVRLVRRDRWRLPFGFGWMAGGAGFSTQCRDDPVTRGVRADRVGVKLRYSLPSEWCEVPGGESRPASGPNNLG
jgi:hypothetical protein